MVGNGCGAGLGNSMGLGDGEVMRERTATRPWEPSIAELQCQSAADVRVLCTKDGEVGNQAGDGRGGTGAWDAWDRLWQCGLDVWILMSVARPWES